MGEEEEEEEEDEEEKEEGRGWEGEEGERVETRKKGKPLVRSWSWRTQRAILILEEHEILIRYDSS